MLKFERFKNEYSLSDLYNELDSVTLLAYFTNDAQSAIEDPRKYP